MRRTALLSLIGSAVLALSLLAGGTDGPAQARTPVDNLSLDLLAPAQPVPPFSPPDPSAPVRAGTPGTDLAHVPLQPLVSPESVIPPDDRSYIGAGKNILAPYRWVAYLTITAQNSDLYQCTGFLIGPSTVITAGHCLYNDGLGPGGGVGWAASVRVVPGRNGAVEPFGAEVSDDLWSVDGWIVDANPEYDYGAIGLDHAFPGLVGSFRYADLATVGLEPRLSGYPGDRPGQQQWYDDDIVTDVATHIVSYEIDTYGGQSGSPVWYPPSSADPEVLAIHGYGVGSTCNAGDNCGTRVETTVMANFEYWTALSIHHYKCYEIAGTPPGVSVDLRTRFGEELGVEVGEPAFVCPPAIKNDKEGNEQLAELKCYDIVGWDPPQTVNLTTQFGGELGVDVGPADLLCVPALKEVGPLGEPPSPPPGPPPTEPHYVCHQIDGHTPGTAVDLETQFGEELDVAVGQTTHLCTPALKNGEGDLNYPDLECYQIYGDPPGLSVSLTTQFVPEQIPEVGPAQLLCVQAEKEVVGPVGGIAELPDVGGSSGLPYAALAGGLAAAALTVTAGGWYARRRFSRR
jgi:glutamyl endopeptidase